MHPLPGFSRLESAWLCRSEPVSRPPIYRPVVDIDLVSALLNYFLGEEFLFRGVLLPKMKGVFGRWDWVTNVALFGLYHVHKPWEIPSLIVGSLAITWPARRFQSNWMTIVESVTFFARTYPKITRPFIHILNDFFCGHRQAF